MLLSTKNLRLPGTHKLHPCWVGPFKILQRIGATAYKLDLQGRFTQLYSVFHTSNLKPYLGGGMSRAPPEPVELEGQLEYEVDMIKAHRRRVRRLWFLTGWLGYSSAHDEWLDEEALGDA